VAPQCVHMTFHSSTQQSKLQAHTNDNDWLSESAACAEHKRAQNKKKHSRIAVDTTRSAWKPLAICPVLDLNPVVWLGCKLHHEANRNKLDSVSAFESSFLMAVHVAGSTYCSPATRCLNCYRRTSVGMQLPKQHANVTMCV